MGEKEVPGVLHHTPEVEHNVGGAFKLLPTRCHIEGVKN